LGHLAQEAVAETGTPTEVLTTAEQRLAEAWGSVLGISPDRISRQDSFPDLGGTSLSAVKLVVLLKRAVSLQEVLRTPVLADLAALLDASSTAGAATPPTDPASNSQDAGQDRLSTPTRSQ
jgi:hypothetical protein